jgi:hypothetical protein
VRVPLDSDLGTNQHWILRAGMHATALHEHDAGPGAGIQPTTHLQHRLPALRDRGVRDTSAYQTLKFLLGHTLLRPLKSPPRQLSNLICVSPGAQITTSPIVAASFEQVSIVGVFTNLTILIANLRCLQRVDTMHDATRRG